MITIFRSLIAFAPALLLAACVSVAPHTISMDSIRDLKLVDVEITCAEVIRSWPISRPLTLDLRMQSRNRAATPVKFRRRVAPARDFIAAELRTMVKSEFNSQFADVFVGSRPARAVVHLKTVDIPVVRPSTHRRPNGDHRRRNHASRRPKRRSYRFLSWKFRDPLYTRWRHCTDRKSSYRR